MAPKQWLVITGFCIALLGFGCQRPYSPSREYGMQQEEYMSPQMRDNFSMLAETMRGMYHMMGQGYMGQ